MPEVGLETSILRTCDKITRRLIRILHNVETRPKNHLCLVLSLHVSDPGHPVGMEREAQEASVGGRTRTGPGF